MDSHIEVLEYAMGVGIDCGVWTIACVAQAGNLNMMKWLREGGVSWNEDVLHYVANGKYELFRWAKKHGCPGSENFEDDGDVVQHMIAH